MNHARIAVYMPAYEPKEAHIRAAVESVLAQTCSDWTLLINDDASVRENTESHIRDYLTDPRITFRRNQKNLGIGGNWNACWRNPPPPAGEGSGERGLVAFLFHDDLWEPTYLEKMIAALDLNPSAGFAAANHTYLKEGDVLAAPFYDAVRAYVQKNIAPGLHEHREFLHWWLERGLRPNVIGEPSFVVLRRSLMKKVGPFNASMVQFLDSEYWARCLLQADWVYVAENLGKFRVHPAGMSAVNEGLGRGIFERFQTLQTVVAGLPPEERSTGNAALVNALSGMIGKYFARRKEGKSVTSQGSGGLRSFVLRHPILTLRAILGWTRQEQNSTQQK